MHSAKVFLAVSFVAIGLLTGCSQRSETSQATADTTAVAPYTPQAEAGLPDWVGQIRQGETELGQMVEQGRLSEVHAQAGKLQGALKQVSELAASLTPDLRQQVTGHVAAADRLVAELHDAGDAGDLTKAKAKFREFQTHLRAIEGVYGVIAP